MKSPGNKRLKRGEYKLPPIRFHMMSFCDCPAKLEPLEIRITALCLPAVEVKYRCPECGGSFWCEPTAMYSRWHWKKERLKRRFHQTMVALLTSRLAKWIYRRLK